VAQRLASQRLEHGALEFETIEARTQFDGDAVSGLVAEKRNRAKELIENLMIAAKQRRAPAISRSAASRWCGAWCAPRTLERIVDIALHHGAQLPAQPDARALNAFLVERRAADPTRFPDLSLSIIKLLGRGEYVASFPGESPTGHFGLAVSEYTHSTAPNRRYPDLITQRLLKAALAGGDVPYGRKELEALASNCTLKEDAAQKVERLMRKAAPLSPRRSDRPGVHGGCHRRLAQGHLVRIFDPPVEGRVEQGPPA